MKIKLIGDVHGKYQQYLDIIRDCEYSIQLGDLGFNYDFLNNVDSSKHRILLGNHEAYNKIQAYPHFLGDFGIYNIKNLDIFYIRGGYSIDRIYRTLGIDWFPEEELNYIQSKELIELYTTIKPNFVISHECPSSIVPYIGNKNYNLEPSYTAKLLQILFKIYPPKTWIYAHHHKSKKFQYQNTLFVCVGELDYITV